MNQLQKSTYDEAALHTKHPPRFRCERKQLLYETAIAEPLPSNTVTIEAIRWKTRELPVQFPPRTESKRPFHIVPGLFDYKESTSGDVHWYLNFADPQLFVAYGTPLLAQDELQVAEHPALACLREALIADDRSTSVEDEDEKPTPFTIRGVPRRIAIDTTTGLYGNAFSRASTEAIREAVHRVKPVIHTNILAITAPPEGEGRYAIQEIKAAFVAAYTGFFAARQHIPSDRTTIHTGFWGCGAFGGNRTLMTIVQAVAAESAGVDVVFHAFDEDGITVAQDGYSQYQELRSTAASPHEAIDGLHALGYAWGESDGN